MNRDNQLMLEALQSKFLQPAGADTYVANQLQRILNELENISSAIHLSKSSHADQLLSRVRDTAEMLMSERGSGTSENAEGASHVTAIQNVLMNELKKRGFQLNKVSHAHAEEQDGHPTVFMHKRQGAMHTVAEISPMGEINGEHYKDYMASLSEDAEDSAEDKMKDRENAADEKQRDAEVSGAFHYDPMPGLMKTAHAIRDALQGAANDEARTEHIIKMAQTILGDPKEHNAAEYRKMLDGLIVLLNRFIVVPMN
jgi:hypothetical protein